MAILPNFYTVSIESGEDFEAAISKIKRETRNTPWRAFGPPADLYGNYKVLTLTAARDLNTICKIDGPGFLIDDLFKHYLKA